MYRSIWKAFFVLFFKPCLSTCFCLFKYSYSFYLILSHLTYKRKQMRMQTEIIISLMYSLILRETLLCWLWMPWLRNGTWRISTRSHCKCVSGLFVCARVRLKASEMRSVEERSPGFFGRCVCVCVEWIFIKLSQGLSFFGQVYLLLHPFHFTHSVTSFICSRNTDYWCRPQPNADCWGYNVGFFVCRATVESSLSTRALFQSSVKEWSSPLTFIAHETYTCQVGLPAQHTVTADSRWRRVWTWLVI